MSLKNSWQQQRQQRQQEVAQRQQTVAQNLAYVQQGRYKKASQLRDDLSLFRETLASNGEARRLSYQPLRMELSQFCAKLRIETQSFLTAAGAQRQAHAQQLAQQLDEFVQALQQETRELLAVATTERALMAQQLEKDLTAFIEELRSDVESYLLEVATVRKNRAEQIHEVLVQSRIDREAEMQVIFQRFADFRVQLRHFREKVSAEVWGNEITIATQPQSVEFASAEPKKVATNGSSINHHLSVPDLSKLKASNTETSNSNNAANSVVTSASVEPTQAPQKEVILYEKEVYNHIHKTQGARLTEIESSLGLNRFQAVDALRSLIKKGLITQRDRVYLIQENLVAIRG